MKHDTINNLEQILKTLEQDLIFLSSLAEQINVKAREAKFGSEAAKAAYSFVKKEIKRL